MSRWEAEIEDIKEEIRKESIRILVWGPGDPGEDVPAEKRTGWEKRKEIRQILDDIYTYAEVRLSEDREMLKASNWVSGKLLQEAIQASKAHLVIMLDTGSRGLHLELDYFPLRYSWFSKKAHVFIPKRYIDSEGLVGEVFKELNPDRLEGYTEEEFETCTLATEKAVRAADTAAGAYYLQKFG